jgi:hypothetical protein
VEGKLPASAIKMVRKDPMSYAKGSAVHVVWSFPYADSVSVSNLHDRLIDGQRSHLFAIEVWDPRDGKVSAILTPKVPLDRVVEVIRRAGRPPSSLWVESI